MTRPRHRVLHLVIQGYRNYTEQTLECQRRRDPNPDFVTTF